MSHHNHHHHNNSANRIGFAFKKDTLSTSSSAFLQNEPQQNYSLPKPHTDDTEKKFLQLSSSNVQEEDLYDPFALDDDDEEQPLPPPPPPEQPKPKKRKKTRWDVDDDIAPPAPVAPPPPPMPQECMYLKGCDSPEPPPKPADDGDESEEDELDKFMAGVEDTLEKEEKDRNEAKGKKKGKDKRVDLDDEDDQESYFKARKDVPLIPYPDEEEEIEYDSDGNPIPPEKSKVVVPLPQVDHEEITYAKFERNFYEEHPDITKLTAQEVHDIRATFDLKVMGAEPARPAISFAHFGFDSHLMGAIRKSEYSKPTAIQLQGVPVALSGRDVIGIAMTGSGKTAAFIWPMLVHIMAQPELQSGDGPIGLICSPTRELCQQIHTEAKRFGKCYNLRSVACYGGGSKWEQTKALQQGAEIVVATPGRLVDLVRTKAASLLRVTYLVFDEADRMFEIGFEPQVRSIANNVRPDRQCLLFSATMKKKIELLCRDILTDPIRIVVGELGEANQDVVQAVEVMKNGQEKWTWLLSHLVEFTSGGSVLIFVTKKTNCEEVAKNLREHGYELGLIHGDFDQFERNSVIKQFKQKEYLILVATDVAARGLDIPSIKTVINYDVARDITTHTHRIGRTGRAGEKGIAYTLITAYDTHFTADLVRNLESANQRVPKQLYDLALKNPWFKKTQARRSKKASHKEFTPRDRPGFGLADAPGGNEETASLEEEEDIFSSRQSGKRPSRSLLTSYSMNANSMNAAAGTGRLSNLKSAFKSGYNRFAKASDSSNSTMDVGVKGGVTEHFDPANQPKSQSSFGQS